METTSSQPAAPNFKWLDDTLNKRYEIKTTIICHGPACSSEGPILNRVVRATDKGFKTEANPRHAELDIVQLGLLMSKGATTPGVDGLKETQEHAYEALDSQVSTALRAIAARCNYVAADRPDIMYPF